MLRTENKTVTVEEVGGPDPTWGNGAAPCRAVVPTPAPARRTLHRSDVGCYAVVQSSLDTGLDSANISE